MKAAGFKNLRILKDLSGLDRVAGKYLTIIVKILFDNVYMNRLAAGMI